MMKKFLCSVDRLYLFHLPVCGFLVNKVTFLKMTTIASSVLTQKNLVRILSSMKKLKDVHLAKESLSYLAAQAHHPS